MKISLGAVALLAMLNGCGGGTHVTANSTPPPVAPSITMQPANQQVAVGQTATFSVTATGTAPLSYQWQKGGMSIAGATAASYTTPAAVASDNNSTFAVVVSNAAGTQTSNNATLTVTTGAVAPPSITKQPANQQVVVGQTASFSVTAGGTGPFTYQWMQGGTAISGATAASYTTPATVIGDNGKVFSVAVTNAGGTTPSNNATLSVTAGTPPGSGTDIVTYKYDLSRSGQNLTETALTATTVTSAKFGLLRNIAVDGKVDAQPLYLSHLAIAGGTFNTLFVATEHGSVYAIDSDTGTILWHVSVLAAGETPSDDVGCNQVTPEIGVTSTPVIDRAAGAHGTLFLVAMSKDASSNYHQRVHALDVTTGAELLGGPVSIAATFPNSSGMATFDPRQYEERAALLLSNGTLYTSWTSHCDNPPYAGWIIAFSESSLARTGVLNIAANSQGGPAIWMAGGGPSADSSGNIYLLTANGAFETTMDANGFPNKGDYGNSFLKISSAGAGLAVLDYWTMFNEVSESNADEDLGSGGEMLLPDLTDSSNKVRHLMVGAGKDSNLYVVDRDSMGKFNASSNNNYQTLSGALPGGIWSTPAYFNGTVYYGSVSGNLRAFSISSAKLAATPTSQSPSSFAYPGTAPSVSANGSTNGIVWAHETATPGVLHAYDATNLAHELYNSNQAAANRDHFGGANKFITPAVADGKVFIGTTNSVVVFGLLP
jgi:outer membrane protein assembly factor BamB